MDGARRIQRRRHRLRTQTLPAHTGAGSSVDANVHSNGVLMKQMSELLKDNDATLGLDLGEMSEVNANLKLVQEASSI